jgi:hypothetical protein
MKFSFLFILILLFTGYARAQTVALKPAPLNTFRIRPSTDTLQRAAGYFRLSPDNNYQQHFGFFCKQEWLLEKKTNIPFRFRLGSLEQTDRREGKH